MPRNCKIRTINHKLQSNFFKPNGIPLHELDIKEVGSDEIEALRLAYIEGLNMVDGAVKMGISGPTFNRILNSGITKIADAIINSKAIKIR
ncbi:MAG: DUF134 domain-containing protein [Candidatus Gracilibacteria bacterium]|nr:DUF134 domain-containing protein [Candidatus Gracilibacteria bacterium]